LARVAAHLARAALRLLALELDHQRPAHIGMQAYAPRVAASWAQGTWGPVLQSVPLCCALLLVLLVLVVPVLLVQLVRVVIVATSSTSGSTTTTTSSSTTAYRPQASYSFRWSFLCHGLRPRPWKLSLRAWLGLGLGLGFTLTPYPNPHPKPASWKLSVRAWLARRRAYRGKW